MNDNSAQLEMLGSRASEVTPEVQDELAKGCRNRHHALVKCFEVSNLAAKQVYAALDIDQAVFSKILSGRAFLDPNKKMDWMRICGNIIPIRYDALCVNHELKPIQTTLESRVRELESELEQERQLSKRLAQMIRGG